MDDALRERLRMQLIANEGMVLHAYTDSLGYVTIGVGRLIDGRKGGGISAEEALYLLDHDIDRVWADLTARFPQVLTLTSARQAALCDMAFNLGVSGLAQFTNTLAAVWRGDYDAAAEGMLSSRWATQVGLRAVRLAGMMRTGQWVEEVRFA